MKYIDSEKLIAEIERRESEIKLQIAELGNFESNKIGLFNYLDLYDDIRSFITSLQQEQPIKVYRVENEKEQKGLWRKFDGTWEPLFDMLTDGQCKDMPMEDSQVYREGGKQWFASAPSKETLQKWFSKRDLEELTAKGFTISEFEVVGHKKISDFEYIFTRDSIISRTYLKVSDIYPQEQPEVDLEKELDQWRHKHFKGKRDGDYSGEYLERESQLDLARHFYELARKEIMNGWSHGLRDTQDFSGKAYNDGYQLGYEHGKAEALKDLPRWSTNSDPNFKPGKYFCVGNALISPQGWSILFKDLEKLPGFKED